MPSVLSALVEQHGARHAFSLCLSPRSGLLLLGGRATLDALHWAGATSATMVRGSPERFTLRVLDVRAEDTASGRGRGGRGGRGRRAGRAGGVRSTTSLRVPRSALNPTLVDSGTTFFFVSAPLWRAMHARLRMAFPALRRTGAHHVCAHMSATQRDALPAFELLLDGPGGYSALSRPLVLWPRHYMVRYPSPRRRGGRQRRRGGERQFYCADIFNNGRGGTVLGASVLRHREVIFDLATSTISFVDADCDAITPSTAHMRGAYALAPCSSPGSWEGERRQAAAQRNATHATHSS